MVEAAAALVSKSITVVTTSLPRRNVPWSLLINFIAEARVSSVIYLFIFIMALFLTHHSCLLKPLVALAPLPPSLRFTLTHHCGPHYGPHYGPFAFLSPLTLT